MMPNAHRLAVVLLALPLAGCWFPESQASAEPPPWEEVRVEPEARSDVTGRHGGTITWAEVGEVSSFNPIIAETATEAELVALTFDGLVSYDNHAWKYVPALAWKWEHSEDWLTWTFHLRKGLRFSDGHPLTAVDFDFSYRAVTHPKVPNSGVSGFQVGNHPFPTLAMVDEYTIRFDLPAVNALFLTAVSSIRVLPEHVYGPTLEGDEPTFSSAMRADGDLSQIVGSGPFRVVEYSGAERIVYERNPWYWRTAADGARLPFVDRAIVLLSKDLSARSVKFLDGDVDMITDIPPTDYRQFAHVEKDGWFRIHRLGLSLNTNWVSFNQHPGSGADGTPFIEPHKLRWFADVRFRRAMSHAVNREKLVRLFVRGKGEAIYSGTNQGNKTWHVEPTKFPYDPVRAGELLDEMGLIDRDGDGLREDADGHAARFTLMTNVENPLRVNIISQIKADWLRIGVEAQLAPLNFQEVVGKLMDGHDWDCILLGWGAGIPPDPLNGKNILLSSGRLHVWHPMQAKPADEFEAESDRLILTMDGEPDEAKRRVLFERFVEHTSPAQSIIYLYSANAYAAVKSRVQNVKASVLRPQTWHNPDELWLDDAPPEAGR